MPRRWIELDSSLSGIESNGRVCGVRVAVEILDFLLVPSEARRDAEVGDSSPQTGRPAPMDSMLKAAVACPRHLVQVRGAEATAAMIKCSPRWILGVMKTTRLAIRLDSCILIALCDW